MQLLTCLRDPWLAGYGGDSAGKGGSLGPAVRTCIHWSSQSVYHGTFLGRLELRSDLETLDDVRCGTGRATDVEPDARERVDLGQPIEHRQWCAKRPALRSEHP